MMKSIKLVRTIKEGAINFYRDKWLTVATVTIMTLALYLIGATFFLWIGVSQTIETVQNRVNVSVYFDYDVSESEITSILKKIEQNQPREIKTITYISRKQALEDFREQEKDSEDIQKALDILLEDDNPLPASLSIVAQDIDDFEKIDTFFKQEYGELILNTNFSRNKETINSIKERISFIRNGTFFLSVLFVLIAVLVTFNTVRMSIYAHRKEFEVMRLVGASNLYVRMPVITEGVLYGLTSAALASILLVVTVLAIDPFAQKTLADAQVFDFYKGSILLMVGMTFLASVVLGVISSFIAIRRYLER